jgi:hypothetical protein
MSNLAEDTLRRSAPVKRGGHVLAFSESKTCTDWAKDSRCVVDMGTLHARIHRGGWEAELAITTPNVRPKPIIEAFGESKSAVEWSADPRSSIPANSLRERIRMGWDPEDAITVSPGRRKPGTEAKPKPAPKPRGSMLTAFGVTLSTSDWVKDARCPLDGAKEISRRIREGEDPESAITRPKQAPVDQAGEMSEEERRERDLVRGVWRGMKNRCLNPKDQGFKNYGGRGISISSEWLESFDAFVADVGIRPTANHQIERVDNDGNYCVENCIWALPLVQASNKRNTLRIAAFGRTLTTGKWHTEPEAGVNVDGRIISARLSKGWEAERAISEEVSKRKGLITAFSETKSAQEWEDDHRCCVTASGIYGRIRGGYSSEAAITAPSANAGRIDAFGESKRSCEWADDLRAGSGATGTAIRSRIKRGMHSEDAISTPFIDRPKNQIYAFGELKTPAEWSRDRRCVVSNKRISQRIQAGMSAEDAITTPTQKIKVHPR